MAVVVVDDVAQGVDGDNGGHLQGAQLHGINAEAALHVTGGAQPLAHGGAGAGAEVAHLGLFTAVGVDAGLVAHGLVGADLVGDQLQIEEGGAADDGHEAEARVKADALLLQEPHDAVAGLQAVGAAAGEGDGVDLLDGIDGV